MHTTLRHRPFTLRAARKSKACHWAGWLLTLLSVCLPVWATRLETVALPQQEELPTSALNRILVDSEGFIWYGTEDFGLIRDDGYQLSVFRSGHLQPDVILSNHVTCIAEASDRAILFGTKRGLYIINKQGFSVEAFPDKEIRDWGIDALLVAHDGTLWVSTNHSVIHYDSNYRRVKVNGRSRTPSKLNGEWKKVHALHETGTDVWALQDDGAALVFERGGQNTRLRRPVQGSLAAMCSLSPTRAFLSVKGGGLYLYDKASNSPAPITLSDHARDIIALSLDKERRLLWCITHTGLHVYKMGPGTHLQALGDASSLPAMQPQALALTSLGQAWVISPYTASMVAYWPMLPSQRIPLAQPSPGDFMATAPTTVCIQDGQLWYCQKSQGLYRYDASSGRQRRIWAKGVAGKGMASQALAPSPSQHTLYAVLDNRHVVSIDTRSPFTATTCTLLTSMKEFQYIHDIKYDGRHTLWLGTMKQLLALDTNSRKLAKVSTPATSINTLALGPGDRLFIGTEKEGIYQYDSATGRTTHYQPCDNVTRMTMDAQGYVWWASLAGDVFVLDPRDGKPARKMTMQLGIGQDKIVGMASDAQGSLWALCSKSLHIYDARTHATTILHCGNKDLGFTTLLGLSKGSDGKMLVSGDGGVRIFGPAPTNHKTADRGVTFTSWRQRDSLHILSSGQQCITLPPQERDVEIFFSSLNHLYAKETRYAYRLDGDKDWRMLPVGQNSVNLLQMRRGSHRLEVRCTNALGQWGGKSATITLYCTPMWYETCWAFALYALIIASACLATTRYYINKKRQKLAKENMANSAQDVKDIIEQFSSDLSTADSEFVSKVQALIERNVDNSDYSVEQLSADLAMERTGLYRKMMATIGKSPAKYIRSIRLRRAAALLEQGYKVSEAAYSSGFGTARYMSRCFQQEYGMTPSEYVEKNRATPSK